jgi:hypothetical protein
MMGIESIRRRVEMEKVAATADGREGEDPSPSAVTGAL